MKTSRATFGSRLGAVAATAGSAIGLGNIWRFPSETADGGGAIFIFVYIACVLFFGIPLMTAEFIIGRSSRANTAAAFNVLAPGTQWKWLGKLGIVSGICILSFYMVVSGWTLDYLLSSITGALLEKKDFGKQFSELTQSSLRQIFFTILATIITAYFILSGVKKGIERSAKFFMPLLFLILIVLVIRANTLENSFQGVLFLIKPDFNNIKPTVFLDAMGQAFFSLSIGLGCMITYASYFKKNTNLISTSFQVASLDVLVAILAGFVIFPAAFALAADKTTIVNDLIAGGPGLLFISLPELFKQLPLSSLWASLFFLLLTLAAISSTISLMELIAMYFHENLGMTRRKATYLVSAIIIVLGSACACFSLVFDSFDFLSAKILLPIGGIFISLFVGFYLDKRITIAELSNDGDIPMVLKFLNIYIFILRYLAPIIIISIFLYGLLGRK